MNKLFVFLFLFSAINVPAYSQEPEGADFNTRDIQNNAVKGADKLNKNVKPRQSKQRAVATHHETQDPLGRGSAAHAAQGTRQGPAGHAHQK
jgi:hypothetical protein